MIDKPTFIALIDAKSPMLYRIARAILRSEEDCSDALQEAILKAWAARHTLREDAYFGTWIARIVIRECHNLQRKQAKYFLSAEVMPDAQAPSPDDDLHRAIDDLPEKLRLPLVLHYIEGYTLQEIAAIIHLPITTIRNRLYAARKKLRLELYEGKEAVRT
ncbi:MAG: sigma-70 family RNA polymerase sigma factor [Oscillospiraceae bacterium]|jgi:RNA polymerase sigma-70 factor (ECF subfamily)|nr:sigma-70 family RNA polymerase sigma factor [Oscillospiraceae bacterium]